MDLTTPPPPTQNLTIMRPRFATFLFSLFALGCGDDVGVCSDANLARDPVLSGSQVMYGGQAIVNKSCAGGRCHSCRRQGRAA